MKFSGRVKVRSSVDNEKKKVENNIGFSFSLFEIFIKNKNSFYVTNDFILIAKKFCFKDLYSCYVVSMLPFKN